ncbi:hypothetical protein BDK51DRAFT_41485 [Blyttiomyces helicus]|uniref:Uncharacterized protein n=1 Tax=Blyttiomyces helicus TaxID=388810 RepID=A0A4P9WG68_9FUNG|nr:hypothetical protein BDK51DRAFT_41485 [Blyttiomyces helicus]|eukprot:RKO90895.1 hypothetical protein BDK51DRAFT_41485 [Blyttiomyces helicus]
MPTTLESLPWHTQLANYGIPDPADLDPDDADATLLPRLVEKSVLPRLAAVVDAYNPRSARQTALFIKLVGQMLDYTKASGKAFLVLMAAIEQRLEADVVATSTRYSFASVQIRIEPNSLQEEEGEHMQSERPLRPVSFPLGHIRRPKPRASAST